MRNWHLYSLILTVWIVVFYIVTGYEYTPNRQFFWQVMGVVTGFVLAFTGIIATLENSWNDKIKAPR